MTSPDLVVRKLHLLLNSWMVTSEYTEEELTATIYIKSEERLTILKHLMSQFSEDYKNDLDKSQDVEWELIRQIHALHFSEDSNKITFVKAECPVKDQKKVFEKIISALEFLKLAENADKENIFKHAEALSYIETNTNKDLGKRKKFCLEEAMENLGEATRLVERCKHYLEGPTGKEMPLEYHQSSEPWMSDIDIADTCNNIGDISNLLKSLPLVHIPEHQLQPSQHITRLHDILVANSDVIHNSAKDDIEVEIYNPRTFFEDINEFRSNSVLINLNKSL